MIWTCPEPQSHDLDMSMSTKSSKWGRNHAEKTHISFWKPKAPIKGETFQKSITFLLRVPKAQSESETLQKQHTFIVAYILNKIDNFWWFFPFIHNLTNLPFIRKFKSLTIYH